MNALNPLNAFLVPLGYVYVAVALLFLLGLLPTLAPRFYPGNPGVLRRAAAPLLFAFLAVACFQQVGFYTLLLAAMAGTLQICHHRLGGKVKN